MLRAWVAMLSLFATTAAMTPLAVIASSIPIHDRIGLSQHAASFSLILPASRPAHRLCGDATCVVLTKKCQIKLSILLS